MLTITAQALAVMQRVTANLTTESSSGLRIARQGEPDAPLQVRAVGGPQPGDSVLERDGARLYLGPDAARKVEGRELDVVADADSRVQFILRAVA